MIRFPGFHGNSNIYSIWRATYCCSRGQVSSTNSSTISQDPMILWIKLFWFPCSRLFVELCWRFKNFNSHTGEGRNALKIKFKSHLMSVKDRLHCVRQEFFFLNRELRNSCYPEISSRFFIRTKEYFDTLCQNFM